MNYLRSMIVGLHSWNTTSRQFMDGIKMNADEEEDEYGVSSDSDTDSSVSDSGSEWEESSDDSAIEVEGTAPEEISKKQSQPWTKKRKAEDEDGWIAARDALYMKVVEAEQEVERLLRIPLATRRSQKKRGEARAKRLLQQWMEARYERRLMYRRFIGE